MLLLMMLGLLASDAAVAVARCAVSDDGQARVYELQRVGEGERARWRVTMRSRTAGAAPVMLPLPDAQPVVRSDGLSLDYRTLNGGREVRWTVAPGASTLDVRANFELEVNVEPDLDPRVELMNTEGPLTALACTVHPEAH